MNMYDFIEQTKDKHLTIADIEKLQLGDEIDVVMWDCYFEDMGCVWETYENTKYYPPTEFFSECKTKLIYMGNYKWKIHYSFGQIAEHSIHLNVEHLQTNWKCAAITSEDHKIHITNEMMNSGENIPVGWKKKHIHWDEFPKTTRVGWRGPMMLWENLKDEILVRIDR